MLGQYDDSEKAYQTELQLSPDKIEAITGLCATYDKQGKHKEAYKLLAPLLSKASDNPNVAYAFALISENLSRRKDAIDFLEKAVCEPELDSVNAQKLHFMLGKLYDRERDYDQAFTHYSEGNQLKPFVFNAADYVSEFNDIISVFGRDFLCQLPRSSSTSTTPIFIVGMPRSATSLVEQILASHPSVYCASEIRELISITELLPGLLNTPLPYPACLSSISQDKVDLLAQSYLENIAILSKGSNFLPTRCLTILCTWASLNCFYLTRILFTLLVIRSTPVYRVISRTSVRRILTQIIFMTSGQLSHYTKN